MGSPMSDLGDDLAVALLARAPLASRGALRRVCRRFGALLSTAAFRAERAASGWAERGLLVAGGEECYRATAQCHLFAGGQVVPRAVSHARPVGRGGRRRNMR